MREDASGDEEVQRLKQLRYMKRDITILIAEDEPDIRKLLKLHLEERNYRVMEAGDGLEALDMMLREEPDLAVLDVVMPRLDGFNLLREIRKTSHIPVIFLTARHEEMDMILGLGLGADDYLAKPFSTGELMARIEAQLRRRKVYDTLPSAESEQVIQYGNLRLHLRECTLYLDQTPVPLTAKEYKLLAAMALQPNRVFTKKELYELVWEEDYCYDDNTIMATLSRLRSKIEPDPRNPRFITLLRGLGYRFNWPV